MATRDKNQKGKTMKLDPFIDAKELSGVVQLSARHIIRRDVQRRLGIATARDKCCDRPVRFHRRACAEGLRRKKYDVHFDEED